MSKGYFAAVTEYEAGWGSRHDGYIVATSKEPIDELREKWEKRNRGSSSQWTVGPISICFLKENHLINEGEYKWIDRLDECVEEY